MCGKGIAQFYLPREPYLPVLTAPSHEEIAKVAGYIPR